MSKRLRCYLCGRFVSGQSKIEGGQEWLEVRCSCGRMVWEKRWVGPVTRGDQP